MHVPRLPVGERVLASARQGFGMDAVAEFHCQVERAPRAGEATPRSRVPTSRPSQTPVAGATLVFDSGMSDVVSQ